ncbi:MAG TPA: phosphate ABC transporter ATP-binding protein PstB [Saprospiraceae bacterium]|nr:phosphate ABC transporter ATP-binding protein PstB [Saprospiraceae bacterium]HPI05881.1 phosphate ABC transporter ATP-binding protein PstB [Saprospiraceae bacterium]
MEKIKMDIQALDLFFGKKQVLKNIHLGIGAGKITALIGPSGCGKSTLLRSLNRMHDLHPDARLTGKIMLDDHNILHGNTNVVHLRRRVGMVFQKPNPFPMTVADNVAYGMKINGLHDKPEVRRRIEQCLRSSFLWEEVSGELDKSALDLSGGQQQRLCIARAIAVEPEIILYDEPCSALDPISTSKIEELILSLREKFTQVIVTHNMQQAQRVADYTAFMYLGEVIEFGETQQIFQSPRHELTKNYVAGHFG